MQQLRLKEQPANNNKEIVFKKAPNWRLFCIIAAMMKKITKAVFPVAGWGTRFLPATKANPKEMLPIVDKPLIQHAVEEAIKAGVDKLIFITNNSKRAIEDHFDFNHELESALEQRGNVQLLNIVRQILPKHVSCVYIRQPRPKGLGDAILCARPVIGNEPFAVILADDLIESYNSQSCLEQMLPTFYETGCSVIAVQPVPQSQTHKYGIVSQQENSNRVQEIIEKPLPGQTQSNLAAVGRYILTPEIFNLLEKLELGAGGEIQLTDAISQLLKYEVVYYFELKGKRYDCGSKLGYLQATIAYALKHPEIAEDFKKYLRRFLEEEFA